MFDLEAQVRTWKAHLYRTGSVGYADIDELESHLRDSIDDLTARGIPLEEAFLLAVRRMGDVALIHEEFAKISTEDVWKQLLTPSANPTAARRDRVELGLTIGLALLAGLLSKIPSLLGYGDIEAHLMIHLRNGSLFASFPVAIYLIWKRSLPLVRIIPALTLFGLAALVVNILPSYEPHHTAILSALHLPIALLFLLLYFYGGPAGEKSGWRDTNTRLNFVRFIGEALIYVLLIGIGGVALIGLTMGTFDLIDIDASPIVISWIAPLGFFGLFPVSAYLVSKKKHLIESIAPVLAKIFTPLLLLVLISLIIAFVLTPNAAYEDRNMLIWFDLILVCVLALTLYTLSAKESDSCGRRMQMSGLLGDILTLALIISAVLVDLIALSGILVRLSAYGFTPNKAAALGENLLLLIDLLLLAAGYIRYLAGRRNYQDIVEMQMHFLPIFAMWASVVVLLFPPIFGFR